MALDVTDQTFQTAVMDRSHEVTVVVDLWAPWCGPCKTLGPILERAVDATGGKVELAKVNVDENPAVAQALRAQSIPAVWAFRDGQPIDGFVGAYPEHVVQQFVDSLLPSEQEQNLMALVAAGDEQSLRAALEIDAGNEDAVVALAELLVARGEGDEALALLARIPESDRTRPVAAAARLGSEPSDDYDAKLTDLLLRVRSDEAARQEFVDILELMGPHDSRTAAYRKQLTSALY